MALNEIVGYILALGVGFTLGLVGSGGAILSVPILVYIMAVNPVFATGYSLFIVGASSFVGGWQKTRKQEVDFRVVWVFGIPSVLGVFTARTLLVPNLPDHFFTLGSFVLNKSLFLMLLFALLMLSAALKMIVSKTVADDTPSKPFAYAYKKIVIQGLVVGLLAGMVGAGGGFMIIPALVFIANLPMKKAVGSSLLIVAIQSLLGFTGDLITNPAIDWTLLFWFTTSSVIGIFIGNHCTGIIPEKNLKRGFGWFVLTVALYILIREFYFAT